MGPGAALLALLALVVWIVILVWLSERILRFVGVRSGWGPLDPRNLAISLVLLTSAIHFGNYLLDLLERALRGASYAVPLTVPSAFLIGSVAIGVGIAAVRWQRRQRPED
ncbi:hypothetical protein [Pontixanthobacter sp.]|uniref:hypothetical protein n=1 Tax=Pontixanthobacter sp. TaxID=2792078 RepID=UPI003C7D5DE3